MIDKHQAQMLAALACAARPRGAPRWDPAGVVAAIGHVKHLALGEVAIATMRAAGNANLHTPGAIANTASEVWRDGPAATLARPDPYDPHSTCGICGKARHDCERNPHAGHDFESQADTVRNRSTRHATLPQPADEDPLFAYLDRRGA
jgi:hypothetical protein